MQAHADTLLRAVVRGKTSWALPEPLLHPAGTTAQQSSQELESLVTAKSQRAGAVEMVGGKRSLSKTPGTHVVEGVPKVVL